MFVMKKNGSCFGMRSIGLFLQIASEGAGMKKIHALMPDPKGVGMRFWTDRNYEYCFASAISSS